MWVRYNKRGRIRACRKIRRLAVRGADNDNALIDGLTLVLIREVLHERWSWLTRAPGISQPEPADLGAARSYFGGLVWARFDLRRRVCA